MDQSTDIVELEHEIEQLGKEKDLLLKALDVLEDGIHMVDSKGNTILYSRPMEKIEHSKSEYVLGKHISEAYQLNEDTSVLLKVLKSGIAVRDHRTTYITKRGNTASIITNTYPIFDNGHIIAVVSVNRDITKVKELTDKLIKLQKDFYTQQAKHKKNGTQFTFDNIIGASPKLLETINIAKKFAENLSPVLIQGETGTGKELFAQSIHNYSPKEEGPFVAINCAAIPETLLEGILFGTSKGAFTGAEEKEGLFEEADKGTLFLDEINSMSLLLQTKLLRVLQSKTLRRLGGHRDIVVNPRIISAINLEPSEAIAKNQLRNDLYYRLAAVTLAVPPLRDREEEIPVLVEHFIGRYNRIMGKNILETQKEVINILKSYNWPGNVRELEHVVEHAMNMAESSETTLKLQHLPPHLREKFSHSHHFYRDYQVQDLRQTLLGIERDIITQELTNNNQNITQTSAKLGISRQHLQYRLKLLRINVQEN
jgi:arginine utilization regulatory protein